MEEQQVANTQAQAEPAVQTTEPQTTPSASQTVQTIQTVEPVAKPTPEPETVDRLDKHPRFKQVIQQKNEAMAQKNEALARAKELEEKVKLYESGQKPQIETDPLENLPPEERAQTEAFIEKYVLPKVMPAVQQQYGNIIQGIVRDKQVDETKAFADKVGIDLDERMPEIVQFLSKPENRGRLTAKEAFITLYADEIVENTLTKGKVSAQDEAKMLMEKKKVANMQVSNVNPSSVIQSDEAALKNMTPHERLNYAINKGMELAKQGVKNPKVRFE
jgi:hypothetical protein